MTTLFTQKKIKNIKFKNRIVLPPLVRFSIIDKSGYVNDKLLEWYESIAKSDVGLIIVEATCVSPDGKLRDNQLGLWDDSFMVELSKIVEICHKYDTPTMIQLHHAGFRKDIATVDKSLLEKILLDFKSAFVRAKKCGFDGIEIHGAHNYLLSQLASPLMNTRQDEFGGSLEKRLSFARRLITDTRYLFDDDFILGYRMGGNEPELSDGIAIAKYLENLGVDILHISMGVPDPKYRRPEKVDVPKDFKFDWVIYLGVMIKKNVNIPVIGVRKIRDEWQASYLVENDMLDFVAVGRAMIINPKWAIKAKKDFLKRNESK